MGLLTAFYVASDSEALSYKDYPIRGEDAPIGKFEASEFPGITSLEIETLWAILANEEWDADRHILEVVWDKEDGEEMILRFPAELVQLLAQVKDSEAEKALPIWAQSEEMSCTANNARLILTDSRKLAKFALNQGKSLFLWFSL